VYLGVPHAFNEIGLIPNKKKTPKTYEAIVDRIRCEIQARIMVKGRFKVSVVNEELSRMAYT
jgi:hypothetical protein